MTPTADQIRMARIDARLTRKAMAELIGVNEQTVKNWETGRARPSQTSLDGFYGALNRITNSRVIGDQDEWDRWRTIRERAGFDQNQMALFMGVEVDDIVEWERPKRYPTVKQRVQYEELLTRITGGREPAEALASPWRAIRDAAGLSRDKMAERLGVTKKDVWEFDTGAAEPSEEQRRIYEAVANGEVA